MNRILTTFLTAVLVSSSCLGETRTLSLTECRALSIENNKELRMARLHEQGAYYQRKAAFTKYLPKISANGMYMRTGDEISLLSDEQKNTLSHLGDVVNIPGLPLNAVGEKLTDALRTDTRNMTAAAIMLTQPVFMGGQNQGLQPHHKLCRTDCRNPDRPAASESYCRSRRDILENRRAAI